MQIARTPDSRFAALPGYPFEPHYAEIQEPAAPGGTLRVHYLDEGPPDAAPVLLLHGEPTWSYLYRKMIPVLTAAGHRAIAPDLVGFGRSDKPTERGDYTVARHVGWMRALLEHLDLRDVTLFAQDWGGIIGMRLVAENGDRFARVMISNTGCPHPEEPTEVPQQLLDWQKFSSTDPEFSFAKLVGGQTLGVTEAEAAAYDAPFPDESYKAGARQFPQLIPFQPDDPAGPAQREAWAALCRWEKPFLTAFSDGDPFTAGGDLMFQENVPGAADQRHTTIRGAGHFLQETQGEEVARVLADFIARTSA
jgi:haloalkane dehalogenase